VQGSCRSGKIGKVREFYQAKESQGRPNSNWKIRKSTGKLPKYVNVLKALFWMILSQKII